MNETNLRRLTIVVGPSNYRGKKLLLVFISFIYIDITATIEGTGVTTRNRFNLKDQVRDVPTHLLYD